eukprot:CAMPEP_0114568002 /NCGR_PEP_ID=MMETSP0114-20121206/15818_1 /TAXON_ID=31324 /ORGANISM="Goniomonas sp, Strain m" /LENGTH=74 /DNA_ID=CAMNT_0001754701 /DNA_START=219 /DNA_END=439 /DNA_ORIENTATION=-
MTSLFGNVHIGVLRPDTLTVLMALLIVFPLSLLRKFAHLKFSSLLSLAALLGLVTLIVVQGVSKVVSHEPRSPP